MKRAPQRPAAMALVLPTIIVPGAEGKLPPPPPPARPAPSSAGTLGRAGGQKGPRSASADVISQRRQRAPCLVPAGRPPAAAAHARPGPMPNLSPRVLWGGGGGKRPEKGRRGATTRHDTRTPPKERGGGQTTRSAAGREIPACCQVGTGRPQPSGSKDQIKKRRKNKTRQKQT